MSRTPGSAPSEGSARRSRWRWPLYALSVACGLAAAADLVCPRYGHFEAETWFAAYGVLGLAGAVLLVLAARAARALLRRDEEYYGDDRP